MLKKKDWAFIGRRLEEKARISAMGIGVGIGPHLKQTPQRAVQRYKRVVGCKCVKLVAC